MIENDPPPIDSEYISNLEKEAYEYQKRSNQKLLEAGISIDNSHNKSRETKHVRQISKGEDLNKVLNDASMEIQKRT